MIIILLGPPGSGKGTQSTILQKKLHIPHISTGEILRDQVRRMTLLGQSVSILLDQGKLVPDSLVLDMLFERVSTPDCARGYILDGFPRTIAQAEALQERLLPENHLYVFNLEVPDDFLIERLTGRLICPGCHALYHTSFAPPKQPGICDRCETPLIQRTDDTESVIRQRLVVYHTQTAPLIRFYTERHLLQPINCAKSAEEVASQIHQKLI